MEGCREERQRTISISLLRLGKVLNSSLKRKDSNGRKRNNYNVPESLTSVVSREENKQSTYLTPSGVQHILSKWGGGKKRLRGYGTSEKLTYNERREGNYSKGRKGKAVVSLVALRIPQVLVKERTKETKADVREKKERSSPNICTQKERWVGRASFGITEGEI